MDYMAFLNQIRSGKFSNESVNILCSGEDRYISGQIFNTIVMQEKKRIVIIDNSGTDENYMNIMQRNFGYIMHNGLSGEIVLYDILKLDNIIGVSRLRKILDESGYSEPQKQKVLSYLLLVEYIETLEEKGHPKLSYEVLAEYSSNMSVEMKLQRLLSNGKISHEERLCILAKYSEVSSSAADFENFLMFVRPFAAGKYKMSEVLKSDKHAVYIPLYVLGQDAVMKNIVVNMVSYGIEDMGGQCTVILLDNGVGDRNHIFDLLFSITENNCNFHCISRDIMTVEQQIKGFFENYMDVKIYSRHASMESCGEIEKILGDVEIVKHSYTRDYDCRWNAYSPWDILFGRNKTEHYTSNAPVKEPRYCKECINSFMPGTGIIKFRGNTSIFKL